MAQSQYWIVSPSIFIMLAAVFTMPQARATFSGWGVVNMEGAIMDSACAISSESRYQTIDMDTVAIGDVVRDGHGIVKPFSVQLIHCELSRPNSRFSDWRHFQVTFDGDADGEHFGVSGDAKGVALEIKDSHGNIAMPGEAMPLEGITPGNLRLNYTMRLVSNKKTLKSGSYASSIRFKMNYY